MDKDKVVECARALVKAWDSTAVIKIKEDDLFQLDDLHKEVEALKEALEPKPSREDCIEWLEESFGITVFGRDKKMSEATIEYLKKPTMQWVPHNGFISQEFRGEYILVKYRNGIITLKEVDKVRWDWKGDVFDVMEYMVIE